MVNNSVTIIGRLVRDVELRTTSSGKEVVQNCIAVDRGWGESKSTDFINVVAFGKTAENMGKMSFKGQKVAVSGSIKTGSYENKDGHKVNTFDVWIDGIEFLSFKGKEDSPEEKAAAFGFSALDEEVPF